MNEEKLLGALRDGDMRALERIMKKYSGYVCTVAWNFSRGTLSNDDIDELSVEVFYKLWEHREKLDIRLGLKPYLSAAARNAVKNRFRELPPSCEDIAEFEIPSVFSVEDQAELSDMMSVLNKGLEELPQKHCRRYVAH